MKGIVLTRFGEPAEVLELRDLADPPAPGPGEVVLRMTSRLIHPGSIAMVRGRFDDVLPPGGHVMGIDGAGVVEAVGEGVNPAGGLTPGARVVVFPCAGALAERVKARAEFVTPIPDDLPDAIAGQVVTNTVIARSLLRAVESTAPGAGRETPILLTAAGSATARILTISALRRGLKVISTVRSKAGAKILSSRFPDLAVIATADPDWMDQVRRAAGGQPLQAIIDPIGGQMLDNLVDLLGSGGAVILYGGLAAENISVPSLRLVHSEIILRGVSASRWLLNTTAEQRREDVAEAIDIGRTEPEQFEVEAEYDLAQFLEAINDVERPGRTGAVVIGSGA